jgi:hypothetical protein
MPSQHSKIGTYRGVFVRRFTSSLSYANVMATVAVFIALGGGAWAATGRLKAKTGVIHGCVSKRSHVLTIVRAHRKCGAGAVALRFNAKGARGAAGAAGVAGPRGLPGVPGKDGKDGTDGRDGHDGIDGQDGTSPTALFAQIEENGTIRNSTPGVSVSQPMTGEYIVTFPHDVSDCAPAATIGLNSANNYAAGFVAANAADFDEVSVTTFNKAGTATAANAFDLVVACPAS